jgi:hypothetical protein
VSRKNSHEAKARRREENMSLDEAVSIVAPGCSVEEMRDHIDWLAENNERLKASDRPLIPFKQALRLLAMNMRKHDGDESWRAYQVDYPDGLKLGKWTIERQEADAYTDGMVRLATVMNESIDPGPWPATSLMADDNWFGWMSDHRSEIDDHEPFWQAVRGCDPGSTVLIHGLGLGMAARGVLMSPNIAHVDVVEIDPVLTEMLAPFFTSERISIHVGDAHTFEFPEGQSWTLAWHDIWPDSGIKNVVSARDIWFRYDRRTQWQGIWRHDAQLGIDPRGWATDD